MLIRVQQAIASINKSLFSYLQTIAAVWLHERRQKIEIMFASSTVKYKYMLLFFFLSREKQSEMRAVLLFLYVSTSVPVIRGTLSKTDGKKKLNKVQEADVRTLP